VFQVVLEPGALSAWHTHAVTTDRLFVSNGMVRIALYDGREGSPTNGLVNEFRFGTIRPALLVVPPRVWHGVENIGSSQAFLLNLVDRAYDYEDPDHWRVPATSDQIPFRF
jgi:dTDP-4-dehydrorhamnose 3,5-epimerase